MELSDRSKQQSTDGPSKTPSRVELLGVVRKHSAFLKNSSCIDGSKAAESELDMHFWRELVDMFFVRGMNELKVPQDDDLVFFVRHMPPTGLFSGQSDLQPYFVRRWASQLEKVVGENDQEIDWCRSFYLNLIAHTSYTLTVAICGQEALQNQKKSVIQPLTPLYKVSKTVYASPSRVNFQTDNSKGIETVPAYPDIYFMVDDYEDTFEAVVLFEPDHCYCVQLYAHGGAALPPEELEVRESEGIALDSPMCKEAQHIPSKLILFSGFVSYNMIHAAFQGGRSRIGNLLMLGSSSQRSEHVIMRGPTGGELDVFVSSFSASPFHSWKDDGTHHHEATGAVSASNSKTGAKVGALVRKAALAASLVAKQVYGAASTGGETEASERSPLRCCLMSLTLPWNALAYDLLFKGLPK